VPLLTCIRDPDVRLSRLCNKCPDRSCNTCF